LSGRQPGQSIDFLLSVKRDAEAAKRVFGKALAQPITSSPIASTSARTVVIFACASKLGRSAAGTMLEAAPIAAAVGLGSWQQDPLASQSGPGDAGSGTRTVEATLDHRTGQRHSELWSRWRRTRWSPRRRQWAARSPGGTCRLDAARNG
jgi:hypothetical protein